MRPDGATDRIVGGLMLLFDERPPATNYRRGPAGKKTSLYRIYILPLTSLFKI
jgi:hypothetical protein